MIATIILISILITFIVIYIRQCNLPTKLDDPEDSGFIYFDNCVFCNIPKEKWIYENDNFFAMYDQYPVTKGHTLIISKNHKNRCFHDLYHTGLNEEEKYDLIDAIWKVQSYLSSRYLTSDFNIGWNNGKDAGQTVDHFHCHIIPRCKGDVDDPRGGIRGCIPEKMKY